MGFQKDLEEQNRIAAAFRAQSEKDTPLTRPTLQKSESAGEHKKGHSDGQIGLAKIGR